MTNRTFKIWSRHQGGPNGDTVTVTRLLGATTLDKIVHLAHQYDWYLELGSSQAAVDGKGSGLVLVKPGVARINLEFGVKGQITWLCIKRPDPARELVFSTKRYEKVAQVLAEPAQVPNIPAAERPEVLAYRQVAALRQNDHVELWTLNGSIEVLVTENRSGDSSDITTAYAFAVERHTHARVTIQAYAIQNKLYTIRNRWHDDRS